MRKLMGIMSFVMVTSVALPASAQNINPTVVHFDNNQQITVTLSRTGINRLFVRGDKIVSIAAPDGYLSDRNDQQGSVYANVLVREPFSAFVITQGGRHFSVMVMPKTIPSQTIELIANDPTQHDISIAKNSPYQQSIIDITRSLLKGETPRGMGTKKILEPKPIRFAQGELIHVVRFKGALLSAQILRFNNATNHTINLSPNAFYRSGVLSVSLVAQRVAPHGSTEIAEVLMAKKAVGEQDND